MRPSEVSSARKREQAPSTPANESLRRSMQAVANKANRCLKKDLIASARHKCSYERSAHKANNNNLINCLIKEQSQVFYKRQLPKTVVDSSLVQTLNRGNSLENAKTRLNYLSKEELEIKQLSRESIPSELYNFR